jgi:hypothetical protein
VDTLPRRSSLAKNKEQGTAIPKAAIGNASHEKDTLRTKWMITDPLSEASKTRCESACYLFGEVNVLGAE